MSQPEMQKYCTFYLDKYYFGIEVEQVQEIIRFQEITPVALAPEVVKGLINLRGQIVTAVDPANLSGMAGELIQRAYKLEGTLLLTMAIDKVVSADVLNRLKKAA
jgi:hypothetical protein